MKPSTGDLGGDVSMDLKPVRRSDVGWLVGMGGDESAVWQKGVLPVLIMAPVVVVVTKRNEIGNVGGPSVLPIMNVMKLAHGDWGDAVCDRAGGVDGFDSAVLGGSGEALSPADIERNSVFQHNRCAIGSTGEVANVSGINRGAVGIFANALRVGSVVEGFSIDEDADVGGCADRRWLVTSAEQIEERNGCELFGLEAGECAGDELFRSRQSSMETLVVVEVEISKDLAGARGGVGPVAQRGPGVFAGGVDAVLVSEVTDELSEITAELAD